VDPVTLHTRDAELGQRGRRHDRRVRVVLARRDLTYGLDRDAHVPRGHRVERHGRRRRRVLARLVPDRGQVDGAGLPVGVDAQAGGHRVATIRDDLEVEVVERDRLPCIDLDRLTDRSGERRGPGGGRVAVDRR
jgi:hypothetical protein